MKLKTIIYENPSFRSESPEFFRVIRFDSFVQHSESESDSEFQNHGLEGDAENVLDEYHYENLRHQLEVKQAGTTILSGKLTGSESDSEMVNHISSYFSESFLLEMTEKIKQINSRFDEILKDREALQLTNEEGKRRVGVSSINISSTSHFMNKNEIFGMNNDKKKIIDLSLFGVLWDDEKTEKIKIIPILGMGGIGKTTLAKMVYHDLSDQSMFDVMAWLYVSGEYDIIRLTKEIIECATGEHRNRFHGLDKMHEVLQEELVGKTMFLVLDDVWNMPLDDWEMLFVPLKAAKLVRVLVTSRNDAVVRAPYTVSPHRLQFLPEDECMKLLYHCAFGGERMTVKEQSPDIGRQIIKKCGRLPLAIKCIGRALSCNKDKNSWRDILDSELWESNELDPIFLALKVSYYDLPSKLRDCLLFCSLFPKGCRLRRISIIYMWMAHGFLQPKGRKRAEDMGDEYLAELEMRSFIIPCTKSSFCLHNIIYDLARSISAGEIHSIIEEKSTYIPDNIQHLYINKGNRSFQSFRPKKLRTLFNARLRIYGSFIDLHSIRSVRVLGLIGGHVLAFAQSPLNHLRYLGIMEFDGETLPESLCLLYHLQTLEVTDCHFLRELPQNIANLVNLRYLHITRVGIAKLPAMLWQVSNLQMLRFKECYNFRVMPLGISKLKNLQVLQLKSCKQLKELPTDIGNLIKLSLLDLSFSAVTTFPASINLLKSTKVVLTGVPLAQDLPGYPSKWDQELIPFGSQPWQKIGRDDTYTKSGINWKIRNDVEGIDSRLSWISSQNQSFNSRITWMSSPNQSSIGDFPYLDQELEKIAEI
ncbi:Disease resistance protein (CC-NBS-LRR class) family [Rhynchospora pubera]|uniref:Disease resistance protein (CC-NBS-LRR class) family n=1 Tax=Rhynchospora pubera TaxID=906938 RepID=A0AAV8H6D9_9POAL|nr:Disease resistance protein (CC-NBS-LRR class) family [Rhynchospora pubera]